MIHWLFWPSLGLLMTALAMSAMRAWAEGLEYRP